MGREVAFGAEFRELTRPAFPDPWHRPNSGQSDRTRPSIVQNALVCLSESVLLLDVMMRAVSDLDLGPDGWDRLVGIFPEKAISVVVYGSRARGDHLEDSDLDVLIVVETPRGSIVRGTITVSFYTPTQLESARGTLFGVHLRHDAVIIHDTGGWFGSILGSFGEPEPRRVLALVQHLSAILRVPKMHPEDHLSGLIRLARYLLRSAMYAKAIEDGEPCFSVRELAGRYSDPELPVYLASNAPPTGPDGLRLLEMLERRLDQWAGIPPATAYASLSELVVTEWDSDRDRATMAALVIGGEPEGFDYTQMPKVLL